MDEQFWALICEDEDWLDSEFDEIVSQPAESPRIRPPRLMVCADRDACAVPGSVPPVPESIYR